jgi:hypothetical protein
MRIGWYNLNVCVPFKVLRLVENYITLQLQEGFSMKQLG